MQKEYINNNYTEYNNIIIEGKVSFVFFCE